MARNKWEAFRDTEFEMRTGRSASGTSEMTAISVYVTKAVEISGLSRSALYKLFKAGKIIPRKKWQSARSSLSTSCAATSRASRREVAPMYPDKQNPVALAGAHRAEDIKALACAFDGSKFKPDALSFQAAYLAARYRLSPCMARLVSSLQKSAGGLHDRHPRKCGTRLSLAPRCGKPLQRGSR